MSEAVQHLSVVHPSDATTIQELETRANRRSIIREFLLNTSAHALPWIARSNSIQNRAFWSISFIAFTGIMIFFVVRAIMDYFEYPTKFNTSFVEEWPQYFPAFSLCHASALRLDRLLEPYLNYTKSLNVNISNDTKVWSSRESSYIFDFIATKLNRNESSLDYYFSLSSIMHSCSFNSVPCSATDFISFLSPSYGLCHTFNAKLKNSSSNSVRYANQHGGDGILDMSFYIHTHQHIPFLDEGIGMISLVHDNTQVSLIEVAGIHLRPGRKHKLGYKKKTTFFLPAPFTKCTRTIPPSMEKLFANFNGADYGYSTTICFLQCRQSFVYEQCGCTNPNLWGARWVVNMTTRETIAAPLCNQTDVCFVKATDQLLRSPSLLETYCSECPEECTVTDFIIQSSSLAAPYDWQKNGIKIFVENSTVPLPSDWSTAWDTYITANYLSISVVRLSGIVENSTQTATIGLVDVLSNIGGQTGLWIGISFLSIMEVIEMLYRLLRYQCHQIYAAIQRQ